jgi:hypothetical protein
VGTVGGMFKRLSILILPALAALVLSGPAGASGSIRYGIQDDAWLEFGPGTLEERLDRLDSLGVDLVRFTIRWDQVARTRPVVQRSHLDDAYQWERTDAVLRGLRARGLTPVVTLLGTPRWASGFRSPFAAPKSGTTFGNFAFAAGRRYPWVKRWLIWSEPNQRRWLRNTSPELYVRRLLNPAYGQLHKAVAGVKVGGGVTAPRGSRGGHSPVDWIRGMDRARARLDAYAHHPYPLRPKVDTPFSGGCTGKYCETITMSTIERLISNVRRAFGKKRIWLTEYGYQTSPQDRMLGVSWSRQARYLSEASLRAFRAPYVDMLIHFLVQDDRVRDGWQSGLWTTAGRVKPAARAFSLPLAQIERRGTATTRVWGQVRVGSGARPYRLRLRSGGKWRWLPVRRTTRRGFFAVSVRARKGSSIQLFFPRESRFGASIVVR